MIEMNDSELLRDLVRAIGTITYGKERWFAVGNGLWYDRKECNNCSSSEMVDRVIEAVSQLEEDIESTW